MRIAFISDIHGNAVALDAVLADIEKKQVDKIYVLGDISYRGPEPKRALDLVRSLNTDVIKGNADEWVVRGVKEGEVAASAFEMMNKERDWIFSQLDEESIRYLDELPTELNPQFGKIKIHAFHATPNSLFDVVQPFESDDALIEKMMGNNADIFIYAHIHKPFIRYIEGKCLINIGSVGLPFDGLAKSSYAIVDVNEESFQTSIVRVNYDVSKVIKQYKEANYPNSEQMVKVIENGRI
ncbi:metallophosphoesterase [Bacillus sp. EB600]|uniref:metallophosphoesterase family protein n=1 Tax=Bacillus sp. EB600 TaxID=2806345 RepID=UPI00210C13A0|nr:YfcE family phosphodiesterase [Bacillus sp. EB600]MCQ6278879.1 metallophosphoesterase family protein [Bacillus sp. EB600]